MDDEIFVNRFRPYTKNNPEYETTAKNVAASVKETGKTSIKVGCGCTKLHFDLKVPLLLS